MGTAITTILDDEVLAGLDALADDRPRETLIAEAVRRFVEERGTLAAAIEEGRTSIAAGRGMDHQSFLRAIDQWREQRGIGRRVATA